MIMPPIPSTGVSEDLRELFGQYQAALAHFCNSREFPFAVVAQSQAIIRGREELVLDLLLDEPGVSGRVRSGSGKQPSGRHRSLEMPFLDQATYTTLRHNARSDDGQVLAAGLEEAPEKLRGSREALQMLLYRMFFDKTFVHEAAYKRLVSRFLASPDFRVALVDATRWESAGRGAYVVDLVSLGECWCYRGQNDPIRPGGSHFLTVRVPALPQDHYQEIRERARRLNAPTPLLHNSLIAPLIDPSIVRAATRVFIARHEVALEQAKQAAK